MRKLALVLALALSLAGCTSFGQLAQVANLATATISNPVTKDRLYDLENATIIAFAALNAYKQTCLSGAADVNCKANIRKIQVYTRQIPGPLARLRLFVKNNDQINAITVYNEVVALIVGFKKEAVAAGVPVGGL